MIVLALIPVLIWLYLLVAHAGFWRVHKHLPPANPLNLQRRVVVVIPARDEAATIRETVSSLLAQTLPPEAVIVVDDNSSDNTGELARDAGAVVLAGKPLIAGWTGKLWALSQGLALSKSFHPEYLLFTDADITHAPNSVQQLVSIAESGAYDLASFMVKLRCDSLAERALIPAFVFFFFLLYPPGRTPGAAGGCVLIRPQALEAAGGLEAIRDQVIDDCSLAKRVSRSGGRLWLGLTPDTVSSRSYGTFAEIGRMISRTAFNQLHHSTLLLLGTLLGLFVSYLLPVGLLLTRYAALGLVTWLLMVIAYAPMVRFYRINLLWSFALPAIATFYAGATVHSALRYWSGSGGLWKGRVQDAR